MLRGIFLCAEWELRWFYQEGAGRLFPERYEEFLAPIPEAEHGDLMAAYARRLFSEDPAVSLPAARAWSRSELLEVPDAGHSAHEPGISRALVAVMDRI